MLKIFITYIYNTFAALAVVFLIGGVVITAEALAFWIEYLGQLSIFGSLWVWIRTVTSGTGSNPGSESASQPITSLENCVGGGGPCPGLQLG